MIPMQSKSRKGPRTSRWVVGSLQRIVAARACEFSRRSELNNDQSLATPVGAGLVAWDWSLAFPTRHETVKVHFEVDWWFPMDDQPNVGFINALTIRISGHHDVNLIILESLR